ncbi:MAG: hypothetical protein ACRCX8_05025 [Sarcina sp.]
MTSERKALWNNKEVTILGIERKTSFGDLVKIKLDNETKIVNSNYLRKLK